MLWIRYETIEDDQLSYGVLGLEGTLEHPKIHYWLTAVPVLETIDDEIVPMFIDNTPIVLLSEGERKMLPQLRKMELRIVRQPARFCKTKDLVPGDDWNFYG